MIALTVIALVLAVIVLDAARCIDRAERNDPPR